MGVASVTTDQFEETVLKSDVPVVVDFWAPWCGPCQKMGPVLDELATEMGGSAKIVKVNIDDEGSLATDYNVSSIPTFAIFNGGELKAQMVGMVSKDKL